MMKKYVLLMYLTILWSTIDLKAQQINVDNIVSPEAYQFTKYTDMPVSEYTGIPNISIPLYRIDVKGGYSLPINLTYHAKGVAVEEEASEIGMGWNMNFGSIIQYVKGENDLDVTNRYVIDYHYTNPYIPWTDPGAGNASGSQGVSSYMRFCTTTMGCNPEYSPFYDDYQPKHLDPIEPYPFDGNFSGKRTVRNYLPIGGKWDTDKNLISETAGPALADSAPDIFKASFLGEEVTFIFNFENRQNINDIISLTPNYIVKKGTNGFNITNPQGIIYTFNTKIKDINLNGYRPSYQWYLTKIEYPNKQRVSFSYTIDKNEYFKRNHSTISEKILLSSKAETYPCNTFASTGVKNYFGQYQHFGYDVGLKGNTVILNEITFSEGIITINHSEREDFIGGRKIDKIIVKDFKGSIKKEISFFNEYKISTGIESAENDKKQFYKRLFLNSVEVGNKKYQFIYNNRLLPNKRSFSKDYWGYYNGKNNATNFPNPKRILAHVDSEAIQDNGNDRRPDLDYAKAGVLEQITYPTGGFVTFDYEFHEFDFPLATSLHDLFKVGNGLRIKKITHFDYENNKELEKEYLYDGGRLHYPVNFYRGPVTSSGFDAVTVYDQTYYEIFSNSIYSSSSLGSGNTIGYSKVIIKNRSVEDLNKSFIKESYFTNNDDKYVTISPSSVRTPPSSIINDQYINNGSLEKEILYNSNGEKVTETINSYDFKIDGKNYGTTINTQDYIAHHNGTVSGGCSNYYLSPLPLYDVIYYPIYIKQTLLESSTTKEYLEGGLVEMVKNYRYDGLNRLISETTKDSKGRTFDLQNRYPSTTSDLYKENRLMDVIYQNSAVNGTPQPGFRKYYEKDNALELVLLDREVNCTKGFSYPYDTKRCTNKVYDRYDKRGNVLQYHIEVGVNEKDQNTGGADTSNPLVKQLPISILWDSRGDYPVAKVEGATYDAISSYTNNPNDLREALPNAMVTTYEYEPLVGITSITGPNGQKEKYTYDGFNRLEYVLDQDNHVIKQYQYHYRGSTDSGGGGTPTFPELQVSIELGEETDTHQTFTSTVSGGNGTYTYAWYQGIDGSSTHFETTVSSTASSYTMPAECGKNKYVKLVVQDGSGKEKSSIKGTNHRCAPTDIPQITAVSLEGNQVRLDWRMENGTANNNTTTWIVQSSYDNGVTWSSSYAGGSPRILTLQQMGIVKFKVKRLTSPETEYSAVYTLNTDDYESPKTSAFTSIVDLMDGDPYGDNSSTSLCITAGDYAASTYIDQFYVNKIQEGVQLYIDESTPMTRSNIQNLANDHPIKRRVPNGVKWVRFITQTSDPSEVWEVDYSTGKLKSKATRSCN